MNTDTLVIAPGARIEVRDAEWLVRRVDRTSTGGRAIHALGISEIVRDREAVFLEEIDTDIKVLDPMAIADRDTYSRENIKGLFIGRFKKEFRHQVMQAFRERKVFRIWCSTARPPLIGSLPGDVAGRLRRCSITYLAPFDRCDREADNRKAWQVFSARFSSWQPTAAGSGR